MREPAPFEVKAADPAPRGADPEHFLLVFEEPGDGVVGEARGVEGVIVKGVEGAGGVVESAKAVRGSGPETAGAVDEEGMHVTAREAGRV